MIHMVLGCHKSGTTLLAEILHRSGIAMVDQVADDNDYDRGDFFERDQWVILNQDILGFGDPAEDHPAPAKVHASDAQREQMRDFIAGCEARGDDWGFKDPRLCLTYGIWREELPEHSVIAIYRSLPEVWAHFARAGRRRRSFYKVLRMWCDYNRRLADVVERRRMLGQPYLLLRFEDLMGEGDEFDRLQSFVGRKLEDTRSPGRYRARSRSRLRVAAADHLQNVFGDQQHSVIAERLEAARR